VGSDLGNGKFSRRQFIAAGAGIIAGASFVPTAGWARPIKIFERSLSFHHLHTSETLNVVYWANGRYIPYSLRQVDQLFRDFRTDEVKEVDPALLDLLFAIRLKLATNKPFEIYSAYRSPRTNAMLRREGWGVARNSLHMQGKAVDVVLPGFRARDIARAAKEMQRGGVGLYSPANFVHLDVGGVREWGA
jgi:uncharacterized protein YcbK (DUF882 family)